MKLAVIGSRGLNVDISQCIPEGVTEIISGGAVGIDVLAECYADKMGISKKIFYPEYKKYGREAPLIRNRQIVDEADMVVAIWDGKSRGTMHAVRYAKRTSKRVKVYVVKENCEGTNHSFGSFAAATPPLEGNWTCFSFVPEGRGGNRRI